MLVEVNTSYTASITVFDENGYRVSDDSPYITIKNSSTQYWNGVMWQLDEFRLLMEPMSSGVYVYDFVPAEAGEFTLTSVSANYNITKEVVITAYSPSAAICKWQVNLPYLFKYGKVLGIDIVPTISIARETDGLYWDGAEWRDKPISMEMNLIDESDSFTYKFIPATVDRYLVVITSGDKQIPFTLNVVDQADDIPPVIVSSETLPSLDGSNSLCVSDKGMPLQGVSITVYSKSREIIATTMSNSDGSWSIMIRPGRYTFIFEKAGFISVGFERSVF